LPVQGLSGADITSVVQPLGLLEQSADSRWMLQCNIPDYLDACEPNVAAPRGQFNVAKRPWNFCYKNRSPTSLSITTSNAWKTARRA
jgi:hypothetical protein